MKYYKKMIPAIVVVAYNRPKALNRLLESISKAEYNLKDIQLVISIDFEDSEQHQEVVNIAYAYDWNAGKKNVIEHRKNLGLKQHVLSCGDLSEKYGSVILLEDDLFVSPEFYKYSYQALEFYEESDNIGGVSLYNHKRNFLSMIPFTPLVDCSDVYFLQIASSWGQAWSYKQWNGFKEWLANDDIDWRSIPDRINNWPKSSWLKPFIAYLVNTEKYFVYPRNSLTTNYTEAGTHNNVNSTEWQVPIVYSWFDFRFVNIVNSRAIYDSFFEPKPSIVKSISPILKDYDFDVDFYGLKSIKETKNNYIITSKKSSNPIMFFKLELKPIELNLYQKVMHGELVLSRKEDIIYGNSLQLFSINVFSYFFGKFEYKDLKRYFFNRNKQRNIERLRILKDFFRW